jgi:hypothetical protein
VPFIIIEGDVRTPQFRPITHPSHQIDELATVEITIGQLA